MPKNSSTILIILIIVIACSFLDYEVVSAYNDLNSSQDDCIPLDIVFLIDQGNDMVDFDPEDTRLAVTKWMIGVLGYDYLTSCPNNSHKISIVSFGSGNQQPKVDVPLTPLNPESIEGQNGWNEELKKIQSEIEHQYLGGRDFVRALKTADSILGESDPERKQIIIMLTGNAGIPCSSIYYLNTCYYDDYAMGDNSFIFEGIKSLLADELAFIDDVGPYIYILSDSDFNDKYITSDYLLQSDIVDVWNEVLGKQGEMTLIEDDLDLTETLMDIFLEQSLHQQVEAVSLGDIYIDPFMESMFIFGYRSNATTPIDIDWISENVQSGVASGGEHQEEYLVISAFDESEESNSFYYYYKQPPPGKWKISGTGAEFWLFVQPASDISVLEPTNNLGQYIEEEQYYDPDDPHYLTFAMVDDENNSIRQYHDYAATIEGSVIKPDYDEYVLTFTFDDAMNAFVSNEVLHVDQIGTYDWEINLSITSSQPGSDDKMGLIQSSGSYEVNEVLPFTIQFLEPNLEKIPLHGCWFSAWDIQPLEVTAQLVDQGGNPLSGKDIFSSDLDSALTLTVTDETRDISEEYPLEFLPTDDSKFSALISPEIFETEGEYLLEINLEGELNRHLYRMASERTVKNINRIDSILTDKGTYIALGIFLLLCLISGIAFLIYVYTNPIKGKLLFSFSGAGRMQSFDEFDLGRNRKRFLSIKESGIKEDLSIILHHVKQIKLKRNKENGDLFLKVYEESDQPGKYEMRPVTNVNSSPVYFDRSKGIFVSYICDENGEEN